MDFRHKGFKYGTNNWDEMRKSKMILVASRSKKQIHAVKFIVTCLSLVFMSGITFAENMSEMSPHQAQKQIAAWLDVEQTIADEKKDFDARRISLGRLLEIYQVELDLLEEEVAVAGETLVGADSELEAIKDSTVELRQLRERLQVKVDEQSVRLLGIMGRFPRPLLEQLVAQRLTLGDPATKLRAKVVAMVAVVQSTLKFNQVVTYSEEVQVVEGAERQLQVLYLGLGRGYYVSGNTAGVVDVDATGWKWVRKDEHLKAISHAIGVYQKTTRPELVELPIQLFK